MYGHYTSLPRLVDFDLNRQAKIGEYFMYYKGRNKYYVEQFTKAHKAYLASPDNVSYRLTQVLRYRNKNGKENRFDMRKRTNKFVPYLKSLLRSSKIDYLVTIHKQAADWDNMLIKSFERKDYKYGREIFIYQIKF